ncbi:MAG: HD domain-containing protein [Candidatus Omnitrophica bacterium]|nr:HD domain-containing protein [Candidatus Omnitrophota bacterium]
MVLKNELELISDLTIQDWTLRTLKKVPSYFWKAPSSMSGKYHPACSGGKAGLIIHVKRAVYLANDICMAWGIFDLDRDIVISSIILHDIAKPAPGQAYALHINHPTNARNYFADIDKGMYFVKEVEKCVQWHMGRWSPPGIKKPMKDYTALELAVFTADYLSASKELVTPRDMDVREAVKSGINDK